MVKCSGCKLLCVFTFFFSSRRRHTRLQGDWSSDVCSSDLGSIFLIAPGALGQGFAAASCNPAAAVGFVGTPAFFNFFRPSGPNPSFAGLVPGDRKSVV